MLTLVANTKAPRKQYIEPSEIIRGENLSGFTDSQLKLCRDIILNSRIGDDTVSELIEKTDSKELEIMSKARRKLDDAGIVAGWYTTPGGGRVDMKVTVLYTYKLKRAIPDLSILKLKRDAFQGLILR